MKCSWPSTLLFVVALIVATCQCVLACVDQPIPRQVPPCHKHSNPDQNQPQHCAQPPVLVLQDDAAAWAFHLDVSVAEATPFVLPAVHQYGAAAIQTTPPRSPDPIRPTVLRV